MGSRVLSLWLPNLATDRMKRDRPSVGKVEGAYATFRKMEGCYRLYALCSLAERARLKPGMTLDEARALMPTITLVPHDRKGDRCLLETIRVWCERYTPWAAIDQSHQEERGYALWLDIGHASHLFDGEAPLVADLLCRLRDQGLHAKAAIADHPGTAWAMARFGHEEQRILPAGSANSALASLPVSALRLDRKELSILANEGVLRIDGLYALSRQELETRFGQGVVTRLDQALGLVDEPISPHAPLPAQQAQLIFADPIKTNEALRPSIKRLIRQLAVGLEAAGLGARRLTLALYRADRSVVTLSIGSDRPSRQVKRLSRLFIEKTDIVDPGVGIERAIMDAVEIEPLLPETIAWRGLGTDGTGPVRDFAHGRIKQRGTEQAVAPLGLERDSTIEVINRRPYTFGNLATALKLVPPSAEQAVAMPAPAKSLRLLRRPELIEAIAQMPDEPPILFRWRQGLHRVVRAQGPERIAPEWWRIPDHEQPSISHEITSKIEEERRLRDYFAVEDSDGDRFWLFRQGLYQSSQSILPRWYLHGLFG